MEQTPVAAAQLDSDSVEWLRVLADAGPRREAALSRLPEMLLRIARGEVRRRGPRLRLTGPELNDLAYQAAADALIAVTGKLGQFRGESRFTTWAHRLDVVDTGHHDGRLLSIAARGDSGDLHGGLYGWTWGGCGYIDLLWVGDDQPSYGLGTKLLAAAEAEIRRRGCDRVALSTHTFQAPDFYARFSHTECGRTPGYPHGHDDIHLVKLLR